MSRSLSAAVRTGEAIIAANVGNLSRTNASDGVELVEQVVDLPVLLGGVEQGLGVGPGQLAGLSSKTVRRRSGVVGLGVGHAV